MKDGDVRAEGGTQGKKLTPMVLKLSLSLDLKEGSCYLKNDSYRRREFWLLEFYVTIASEWPEKSLAQDMIVWKWNYIGRISIYLDLYNQYFTKIH